MHERMHACIPIQVCLVPLEAAGLGRAIVSGVTAGGSQRSCLIFIFIFLYSITYSCRVLSIIGLCLVSRQHTRGSCQNALLQLS